MATRLKPVDAVIVGMGWCGAILARELADLGLSVVGLERGEWRNTHPDFAPGHMHDELGIAVRGQLAQDASRQTVTFRNHAGETALPLRRLGDFRPGEGVGGRGATWSGRSLRLLASDFSLRSGIIRRYGEKAVGPDMTIRDWPLSSEDLEPFYDRFEYVCGVSGKAGNIRGRIVEGGNPFEAPRSRRYPNPPLHASLAMILFEAAARRFGLHAFPLPSANPSRSYTNAYGMTMAACRYCGFCEGFGCAVAAKASPQTAVLPAPGRAAGFRLRTRAQVLRVDRGRDGARAAGVTYLDAAGHAFEQPADVVVLAAGVFGNVHLMLVSGIGEPYDPAAGRGVIGANYAHQTQSSATLFFRDRIFNNFMGAGALGMAIDDFNGDNFDHTGLDFVGGGAIVAASGGAHPIRYHPVPPGTPRWGGAWKRAVKHWYNRSMRIETYGAAMAYRGNRLDLDPVYEDAWGRPLLRLTFDHGANDLRISRHLTAIARQLGAALRPDHASIRHEPSPYSPGAAESPPAGHFRDPTGGAIMGDDPRTSAVNRYLQCWDVPNLFVVGASAFPQHPGCDPTATAAALAYWAAEAVRLQYVKSPGPLVG
ncbi:MAG: GMC family oxidoreductase [Magnetospirillum sp.]|nr:GMC family oxidoreductase [Magnetospirillum sp.]